MRVKERKGTQSRLLHTIQSKSILLNIHTIKQYTDPFSITCKIWGHPCCCDRPHHLTGHMGQQCDAVIKQQYNSDIEKHKQWKMCRQCPTYQRLNTRQKEKIKDTLTCPPAARCANIKASLPGGRTPPTLPIICLLFRPRFEGVGMTTAGGIAISSFLSGTQKKIEKGEGSQLWKDVYQRWKKMTLLPTGVAAQRHAVFIKPYKSYRGIRTNMSVWM